MSGLEQTFYIMAIIFMSVMFLLMIALVASVIVIRSKINKIHDAIEDKINTLNTIVEKGGELSAMASSAVARKVKKAGTAIKRSAKKSRR